MEPLLTDVHENMSRLKSILKLAGDDEVDVLVLPELCNSGYMFENLEEAKFGSEKIPTGSFSEELQSWSKKNRLVVAGICEETEKGLFNSAGVFANGIFFGHFNPEFVCALRHPLPVLAGKVPGGTDSSMFDPGSPCKPVDITPRHGLPCYAIHYV